MKSRHFAFVALAALALAGCGKKSADGTAALKPSAPVASVAPPAGKAWTDIVAPTPEGGMRIGNPDAPVKFVEYASFTCPHCKKFEDEAAETLLSNYVASGKVSWEFRSFLIHGPDAPVTLLMNCRGPEPYFQLSQQLFKTQDEWLMKLVNLPADQQQALQNMAPHDQFKKMVDVMGLYGFMAARGLPKAQADACLANQPAIDSLTQHQNRYQNEDQINGTPTFFVNGQLQEGVNDWGALQPRLKAAIG
jgi:protein-disulfide isomerase